MRNNNKKLPDELAKFYAAEILVALQFLHERKIVHRDIKCANVFLSSGGGVKLGDLNVSKVAKKGLLYT